MFDLGLAGKTALITGGSDGLGRATAHRLAAEGASVAICARRADYLAEVAAEIARATGGTVLPIAADVSKAADCAALVERTIAEFGGLDILVNNAGASAAASIMDTDDAAWQADFDLKVMAAVRLCRAVIPGMTARGGGAIVNAVCIGLIKSAQWDRRAANAPVDELYAQMAAKVPIGRVGEADEYADLVAFLCSARAAYITGTSVNIDGGMCATL